VHTSTRRQGRQRQRLAHSEACATSQTGSALDREGTALTEAFFRARGEVVLDAEVGRRAGAYLARHATARGVRIADALIAAAATTVGLRLFTLNRRHYPMEDLNFYE